MNTTDKGLKNKNAFVTFIMMNDSFLPGALMLANSLRKGCYKADILCLVTEKISNEVKEILNIVYDYVVEVDEIYIYHKRRQERQDRPYLFTRFHALRLGSDGGLGFDYEKVVVLDADVLPIKNYDELFLLDTPAGTVNEKRDYCLEYDSNGKYIIPNDIYERKKWKWHTVYDDICPHGSKIPKYICERVLEDSNNMGVNSSLLVLTPSIKEFNSIIDDVKRDEVLELIGDKFNWPEMQYATIKWRNQWHNVDLIYNGFGGYPSISILNGIHYAGFKPWNFKNKNKIIRLYKRPDFKYWYKEFIIMVAKDYPELLSYKKVTKLHKNILELQEVVERANKKLG